VFAGRDISDLPAQSIAAAGLMRTFQLPSMPARMTVRDVLEAGRRPPLSFGTVFGRARPDPQVNELIDQFQLTAVADLPASALSGGQKKLLSIATAFRGRPRLLCLDEPTAGVHPNLRRRIVDILRALNALGVTLLVVEHDMAFIRELCRRCVVLDRGTLIADCAPEALTDNPQVVEAYLGKAAQRTKVVA